MRPWTNRSMILGIFGLALIIFGIISLILSPGLLNHILKKELALSPTSRSFNLWKDTSGIPLRFDVYFFNWTNPHELRTPGKKPVMVQLGPYSFKEKREKVDVIFYPENNTVSYRQRQTWIFDPSHSNGSLYDNITQLNAVAVSAATKVRYWSYYWQSSLSFFLGGVDDLHVTKTVDEFLFTGYPDKLIDMGQFSSVALGDLPPFDKFGWFYTRNGTAGFDGHYNMATGQEDLANLGKIRKWNHRETTKFFTEPCNAIEGSAGEFWPPGRTKEDIKLFSVEICRPLTYEYEKTTTHHGIPGYRYVLGDKTLRNDTKRRYSHERAKYFDSSLLGNDNSSRADESGQSDLVNVGQCFCDGDCSPSGVMNVTACRYGAPAFVSLPHFHKADPYYRDLVSGMNPSDDEHDFYLTLEPTTGIPLQVAARLQINILLEPMSYLSLFSDVPKIYFPMFWFEQRVEITPELASSLKLLVRVPDITFYVSIGLILLGSFILIGAIVLRYLRRSGDVISNKRSKDHTATTGQNSELVRLHQIVANEKINPKLDNQLYPQLLGDK